MDLWVVAAAAGVGYVAKYWHNLSGEKDGLSESSFGSGYSIHGQLESRNLQHPILEQTYPFQVLARKWLEGDVSSQKQDVSDARFHEMDSHVGVVSTGKSDDNVLANLENYGDYNVLSLSNLSLDFSGSQCSQGNVDEINGKSEYLANSGHVLHGFGTKETSTFTRFGRNRSLKSRRSRMYIVKPLDSLESCFTAQLHKRHEEVEEYVYSLLPSLSTPTARPLLVTDGRQIISRVGRDSFDVRFDGRRDGLKSKNGVCVEENNTLLGAPSLQPNGLVELSRKPKQRCGKGQLSSFGDRVSGGQFNSQDSPNGMLLFFIGITIGIMTAVIANKKEVDKLNGLLKQTENLVQDLHDELEMKDMLKVKELSNEDYQSQGTNNLSSFNWESTESFFEPELDESVKHDRKRPIDEKAENPELMSKIEAELEAELERLELNMKAASLERVSDFVELDPDFEADVVQGDLKLDSTRKQPDGPSDSDDASGTTTTHTANYAVSPWELSLRLHELIESRLEARIQDLETALQNSHKGVHSLESQHVLSRRGFVYSEVGSSYTPKSPIFIDEDSDIERPSVIYAYNDAYGEIIRMTETAQEVGDAEYNANHIEEEMAPFVIKMPHGQNSRENVSTMHRNIIEDRWSRRLVRDKIRTWEEHSSRSWGSNEDGESENKDEDEDFGKLLIEQIVEKSRSASSVVLNSNQILYSGDDQSISE